ncbi:MAG: D-2-hydroxyacid dehydrogenase [Deltaproteobacteria bacterium]|jgi:glycerate dehydrogenase|nr:D-2-hydroxyacid dehydrogenase [Deltaproteobacteria bacterium]
MKIVVLDGYTLNPGDLSWEGLAAFGELTVYDRSSKESVVERVGDAEVILTNKTLVSADVIAKCPGLKYVGVLATGYNIVDVEAAGARGIVVTNVPAYGTAAVGQFAIALLLEVCHRVGHHSQAVAEGRWEKCPDYCFWDYPLIELDGQTMGIIGFGRIGQQTGRIAKALGMRVLANDSHRSEEGEKIAEYVDLDYLLKNSDVVALHCPLFPETEGLINKESLAKMKRGVVLINNSRGQLVVEEDLAAALESGQVGAAALDVVSEEPIKSANPLLKAKNCLVTPHISWAPLASRRRLLDRAVGNLKAFLDGRPVNVV